MPSCTRAYAATLLCTLVVTAGFAQPASGQDSYKIDAVTEVPPFLLTPFIAMGDDLAPGVGTAFAFTWTERLRLEVEASIGTDAARSSVGLLYNVPLLSRFVYVAGGVGVQHDEIPDAERFQAWSVQAPYYPGAPRAKRTEFAWNMGAGVMVPVTDRWSYRADFRWYNPENAWPESWRVSNGIVFGLRR